VIGMNGAGGTSSFTNCKVKSCISNELIIIFGLGSGPAKILKYDSFRVVVCM